MRVEIDSIDEATHSARVKAQGSDASRCYGDRRGKSCRNIARKRGAGDNSWKGRTGLNEHFGEQPAGLTLDTFGAQSHRPAGENSPAKVV